MADTRSAAANREFDIPSITGLGKASLEEALKRKLVQLKRQPEFQWDGGRVSYAVDPDGSPAVRVAVANSGLDYDLWEGLRSPAMVGLYPVGYREIYEFHANYRKKRTDGTGRATIFQVARSFDEAVKRIRRAVIVSAMLPVSPEIFQTYNSLIKRKSVSPWDGYCKAWGELGNLLDRGITRLAIDLNGEDRLVLAMNSETVKRVSAEAVPATRQGISHGVCKGGNYPQKSIAVITGLGQFGISRIVFRDELAGGKVRRFLGVLRSIVLFDSESIVTDGSGAVVHLDQAWRREIMDRSDFSKTGSEVNRLRFCTYIPEPGEKGCKKCVAFCPSGALLNSSPKPDGRYGQSVLGQEHRYWDGVLQFDNGRCCDDRGQMAALYDEWMCGRCVSICGGEGETRPAALS